LKKRKLEPVFNLQIDESKRANAFSNMTPAVVLPTSPDRPMGDTPAPTDKHKGSEKSKSELISPSKINEPD
jgi:hypothetical protein